MGFPRRKESPLLRRSSLALVHRWLGLALAGFLLPACLTGSVLAWKSELDHWLNPQLFRAPRADVASLPEASLRAMLRARAPQARVLWIEMPRKPGESALASVANWPDARAPARRVNEVFLDPATGAILGTRSTATPDLTRAEFVHWLRRFHYTLALQRPGMLWMGAVAIAWLVDSVLGTILTVPGGIERWRRWLGAWKVRRSQINFDLHRASALWLWPVLTILAISSIYLNLTREVFVPATDALARLLPRAWRDDAVSTFLEWQEPLHTGAAFGIVGRIVICVAGLGAAAGIVTGLASWIGRPSRPRTRAKVLS
jgi:uncharacterized iron-regulated membrane protein